MNLQVTEQARDVVVFLEDAKTLAHLRRPPDLYILVHIRARSPTYC